MHYRKLEDIGEGMWPHDDEMLTTNDQNPVGVNTLGYDVISTPLQITRNLVIQ